jgi:hypothetical protein
MAVKCNGCGNFIQEAGTCPVCGGYVPAESEYIHRKRNASKGFWQDSWDNMRENWKELAGWTRADAWVIKMVLAAMVGIFIYILMMGK